MTLIQSRNYVYLIFNLLIYSLAINTAMLINRAVLLEIILTEPGLIKPIVELLIVEADPINISAIINFNFFSFKLLYFFF